MRGSWIRWIAALAVALALVVPTGAFGEGELPRGFGRILVLADLDFTEVQINGVSYPYEWLYADQQGVLVASDRWYEVIVTTSETERRTFRFKLADGETRVLVVYVPTAPGTRPEPPAPPPPSAGPTPPNPDPAKPAEESKENEGTGFLGVSSSPRGVVHVDGKDTGRRTPARRIELPAGRHEVKVYYDESGEFSEAKFVLIRGGVNTNVFFRQRKP